MTLVRNFWSLNGNMEWNGNMKLENEWKHDGGKSSCQEMVQVHHALRIPILAVTSRTVENVERSWRLRTEPWKLLKAILPATPKA